MIIGKECFDEVNQIKKSLPLCSESISSIREVEGDSMDLEVNAQDDFGTQQLRSPPIDMLIHKHVVRSVEELEDYLASCEVDTAESSEKTYQLEGRRILNLKTFYSKLQEVSSHGPFNCGLGNVEIVSEKQTGYTREKKMTKRRKYNLGKKKRLKRKMKTTRKKKKKKKI
ncbi:unnamed protein product [Parnassius apollo]|uniref:(apollo) hypothetical protein n=1 Tax=Parnassius apollo TaxID=110799 RepID=A0A8S3W4M8_PARAO|nr:unnamed protein product [Parnassius apollo]